MRIILNVALVGDYNPMVPAHQAIPIALDLAAAFHSIDLRFTWIGTDGIQAAGTDLKDYNAIWCVPASPYRNTEGALDAIRFARECEVPFLGTCGGFQHALLEFARNELAIPGSAHAELDPGAPHPLVVKLGCSLVDEEMSLVLKEGSRLEQCYGECRIREQYRCSYGPNSEYEAMLLASRFQPTAYDDSGQMRAAELQDHPFFVGTLFQPERRALAGSLPPLVREFVRAACFVAGYSL